MSTVHGFSPFHSEWRRNLSGHSSASKDGRFKHLMDRGVLVAYSPPGPLPASPLAALGNVHVSGRVECGLD